MFSEINNIRALTFLCRNNTEINEQNINKSEMIMINYIPACSTGISASEWFVGLFSLLV